MQVEKEHIFSSKLISETLLRLCLHERSTEPCVSGNVHPEPVNIWVCLLRLLHQICPSARIARMLFVSVTSTGTVLGRVIHLLWSDGLQSPALCSYHRLFNDLWISRTSWCDESCALGRPSSDTCLHFAQHIHPCLFSRYFHCCWQLEWQFCIKSGLTKYLPRFPAFLCPSGINYPNIQHFGACHSWVLSNILALIFSFYLEVAKLKK